VVTLDEKRKISAVWVIRCCWALLGGVWGGLLGYGGFTHLPENHDTAAWFFAGFLFAGLALAGAAIGIAVASAIGGGTEFLLRRLRLGAVIALLGATVASAAACWTISEAIQAKYPGIRMPHRAVSVEASKPAAEKPVTARPGTCLDKPATERERKLWEAECR
jgi:hypothetical protein